MIVKQNITLGRVGQHHSSTCRSRIIELMKGAPEYRRLIQKHEKQQGDQQVEAVMQDKEEEFRGWARKAIYNIKQQMIRE